MTTLRALVFILALTTSLPVAACGAAGSGGRVTGAPSAAPAQPAAPAQGTAMPAPSYKDPYGY